MEVQIRPATPEDRPYIERWMIACDSTFGNGLSPERPLDGVLALIDESIIFVVCKDGVPVGYAGAHKYNKTDATGLGTYVEPGMRRNGISKALREHVENALREQGCLRVFGLISQYNEKGMASAFSTGYRPVATMVRKDLL